jgi:hypothetical protein
MQTQRGIGYDEIEKEHIKERIPSCLSMGEEGTWTFTVTTLGTYERLNTYLGTYCPRVTHGGSSPFNAAVKRFTFDLR